jgi:hypothetical protein
VSTKPNLPVNQLMGLIRMLPPDVKKTLAQLLAQEQGQVGAELDQEEDLDLWEEDEDWDEEESDEDWDEEDEDWGEEDEDEDEGLDRRMLLAAETFGYSYVGYEDHLGNVEFDEVMPQKVDLLEQAEGEGWDDARLAGALETGVEEIPALRRFFRRAVEVVDTPSPAESFRRGVRFSIQEALEAGLQDQEAMEGLVAEICSRAADLIYLVDLEDEPLWAYAEELVKADDGPPVSPLAGEQTGG